jgi:hypothetical protein
MKPTFEVVEIPQSVIDDIHRRLAKEAGMTLEAYRAMLKEHAEKDWCQCGDKSEPGTFCDDGQRINQHCVRKHHWHCAVCNKLTQVG